MAHFSTKRIDINLNKHQVLYELSKKGVGLNKYAEVLLRDMDDSLYYGSQTTIFITELVLKDTGLTAPANHSEIRTRIQALGFDYCPIQLAPYVRLAYMDQTASEIESRNRHPPDSILIFSAPVSADDDYPKGFYIRNFDGKLWLRGYVCPSDYEWPTETKIIVV